MTSSPSSGKFFGTLNVKVLETREININWVIGRVEFTSRLSEVKKSHSSSHQFSDTFHFQVERPEAELVIEAWRKNLIMKDKLQGALKLPISSLLDEQVHAGWYTLVKSQKGTVDHNEAGTTTTTTTTTTTRTTSAAAAAGDGDDDGEEAEAPRKRSMSVGSSKKKAPSEIRLEIQFKKNTPPKEVLTGIILHDQWTKETSGGGLVNNWKWYMNPQFLLNVDSNATDVYIKLRQPEDSTQRSSFYVVHYDEFYNGRRKVILDTSEIVKVENFFCPITAIAVDSVMTLAAGRYLIIPYTETTPYVGNFTLAVSAKNMDDLDLYKIPKDPSEDWNALHVEGEWTENTSGGGDILGLNWRKNPQYQLSLTQTSDVCVAIEQDENTRSIGLYVVKQIDVGKKVVDYSDEVGKTESFKYLCSSGLKIPKLAAGSYVIIPCTFEASIIGPFHLSTFVKDPSATITPVTGEWKFTKELRAGWTEGLAGGSPNNITFTKNPQFSLSFQDSDKPVDILIQLVQESAHYDEASIGFVVVKPKNGVKKFEGEESFTGEDIFCKPEGWVPKVDVVCRATIAADQKDRSFIVIPSTFKPDVIRSFQLNVYSEEEFTLERL